MMRSESINNKLGCLIKDYLFWSLCLDQATDLDINFKMVRGWTIKGNPMKWRWRIMYTKSKLHNMPWTPKKVSGGWGLGGFNELTFGVMLWLKLDNWDKYMQLIQIFGSLNEHCRVPHKTEHKESNKVNGKGQITSVWYYHTYVIISHICDTM